MPTVIDRSTCKYYADRAQHLDKITAKEERASFIFQTFLAFQKDSWKVASSPGVCRSLEKMIGETDLDGLVVLLKCLSKSWDGAITSKFCRHILQKAWKQCQSDQFNNESLIQDFASGFLDHVRSHFDRYLNHPHAHHTLRLYPQLIAGVQIEKNPLTNTFDVENVKLCTPFDSDHIRVLSDLSHRFLLTKELNEYARSELISPFTQVLLITMCFRDHSSFKGNLEAIMANANLFSYSKNQNLPDGFTHPVLVYFTDVVIRLMPGTTFARFLNTHVFSVSPNKTPPVAPVCLMSAHSVASRSLRAVLRRIKKASDLQELLSALSQKTEDHDSEFGLSGALRTRQRAVINDLAALCGKPEFGELQKLFLQILFTAFGFPSSKQKHSEVEKKLIWSIISMTALPDLPEDGALNQDPTSDGLDKLSESVCLPGCLLAQTLFKYSIARPKRLTASLCTQSANRLHTWAQHPMLSRVLETVFQSTSVSAERKSHLMTTFQPFLTTLACDRIGSHVLDAMWLTTDTFAEPLTVKEQIAEQLAAAHQRLRSHQYGHFIDYKLNLELFVQNKALWRRRILKSHAISSQKRPHEVEQKQGSTAKRRSTVQNVSKG